MARVAIIEGIELHYDCARDLLPARLATCFDALDCDDAARDFVAYALSHPHGAAATRAYAWLRRFLSDYDAYGVLDMYAVHLLSTAQLRELLGAHAAPSGALLDVGAGRGDVTCLAAPLFARASATEASFVMRQRLRARGVRVLRHDLACAPLPSGLCFDAILCLNVLDRCAFPRTLLRHLRLGLAAAGRLVLTVPLPLAPHVQRAGRTADAEEALPAAAPSWEAGVADVACVLEAAGLHVLRLARVPYVCRGDAHTRLHVLDAALFVCVAARDAHEVTAAPHSV